MLTLALTLAAAQAACPEFRGGPMDAAFAVTEPKTVVTITVVPDCQHP